MSEKRITNPKRRDSSPLQEDPECSKRMELIYDFLYMRITGTNLFVDDNFFKLDGTATNPFKVVNGQKIYLKHWKNLHTYHESNK